MPEVTAYHESGHAFATVYLGGRVESITIDPDNDDGPGRFGDTQIAWDLNKFTEEELCRNAAWVALAGPVAEMIYTGDPWHPALIPEWSADWKMAWEAAALYAPGMRTRLTKLEDMSIQIHRLMSQDNIWAAVAALSDELLAHETLEGEAVHDVLAVWM